MENKYGERLLLNTGTVPTLLLELGTSQFNTIFGPNDKVFDW